MTKSNIAITLNDTLGIAARALDSIGLTGSDIPAGGATLADEAAHLELIERADPQWAILRPDLTPDTPAEAEELLMANVVRVASTYLPDRLLIDLPRWYDLGANGGRLSRLLGELRKMGYLVEARLLDAADYGTGITRRRVFILAVHEEVSFEIAWPSRVVPTVSLAEALRGRRQGLPRWTYRRDSPAFSETTLTVSTRDGEAANLTVADRIHLLEADGDSVPMHGPAALAATAHATPGGLYRRVIEANV